MGISRRAVLNGFGQSTTLGALATLLPAHLRAAEAAAPAAAAAPAGPPTIYCLSRLYRHTEGVSFDGDAFRDAYLPGLMRAYGKAVERVELRMPVIPAAVEGQPPPAPPQIIAAASIWFSDIQAFGARHAAATKDLAATLEKITKAPAMEQVDQVLTSLGDSRVDVPVDTFCYSTYFPAKEGGTYDAKYFAETFYPKFASTFGPEAIRRIEVATAATPKAMVTASVHIYIRDEAAYDAAATTKAQELFAEARPYTNLSPVQSLAKVHALG